jgi:glycosyltransferase involved in cell wall biosynthesis
LTLLAVGHGSIVKGWDALEVLWELLRDRFDLRLIVAGNDGHNANFYPEISRETCDRADIRALVNRLKADERVTIGSIPREMLLRHVYWNADIYVHLARMETFGFSILEAMSRELPVVATGLNAIPEIVRHEETGFLVDTKDLSVNDHHWKERVATEAARFVERLIESPDLRLRMGVAARERVARAFSVAHRERVLKATYDEALSVRRNSANMPGAASVTL